VLERLVPIETEVGQSDGSWYLARLLPYRTVEDHIAGVVLSFIDITERKQAEEMRLWLAAVMNATADAIISFSLDYTILSWNSAAERIFGYSAAEATGQPLRMVSGVDPEKLINGLSGKPPVRHVQSLWRRKDGTLVDASLIVSPINDGSGQTMAGTAIVRDITAETAMQEALQLANDKDNILARVSAQLRLPLMVMVQSAERLREPDLDAEQREDAIASIHEQAGTVSVLLGNLLASRS
jgi:two-component system, chemotaxis family, CheB/CheR fusion protein